MFSNINFGAVHIQNLSPAEQIHLARTAGFKGMDIDPGHPDVMADPRGFRSRMDDAGLKVGGASLPLMFRGSQQEMTDSLPELAKRCQVAQAIGCTRTATWLMPCDDDLDYQANFDRHVARLTPIAGVLKDHGLRLGLEFVGTLTLRQSRKHPFIHTMDQVLALCQAIDAESCGVLLDSFHWYTSRATVDDVVGKLPGRVVYVHVNDAIASRSVEEQIDNERAQPLATGVIDSTGFMQALHQIGYDGPVTAEPFVSSLADQPAEQVAQQTADAVNRMVQLASP